MVKVSVIAAMYNAGEHVSDLVASLDAQTMPREEFELIVVDDGSTDDTLAKARDLASTRPYLRVESISNSGWPGRPRNVGTDLARGDYVFYIDHDDRLGPRALEAMHEMAAANGSDIVYGKVVRVGRDTPYWSLWHADQPRADLGAAATSRTVHKLFRRDFLREHGIRFAEGRVRLEDHRFMAEALPRARVVSVLASEPCYYWIYRAGERHISDSSVGLGDYWRDYAQVLATWAAAGGPDEVLAEARVTALNQAFGRFPASRYLKMPPERQTQLFQAVRPLVLEQFPAELEPRLAVLKRLRTAALRADDRDRFDAGQQLRTRLSFTTATEQVEVADGRLSVVVRAACVTDDGQVVRPERHGDQLYLPATLLAAEQPERLLAEADRGNAEITIRHRETGVEWPVPGRVEADDGELSLRVAATVPLSTNCFGAELAAGTWNVYVRIQFLGEGAIRRLRAHPEADAAEGADRPQLPAPALATSDGLLSFRVGAARPVARSVVWVGRTLQFEPDRPGVVVAAARGDDAPRHRFPLAAGVARVPLDQIAEDGSLIVDFWLDDGFGRDPVRLTYEGPQRRSDAPGSASLTAYSTAYGSLSVKRAPESRAAATVARLGGRLPRLGERLGDRLRRRGR